MPSNTPSNSLSAAIKWTFLVSLALLPVACWRADALPDTLVLRPEVDDAPEQAPTRERPFDVSQGGVRYHVEPLFNYRLQGPRPGGATNTSLEHAYLEVCRIRCVYRSQRDTRRSEARE